MVLENIDYHIYDACNLNCASCNHFAPLVNEPNIITPAKADKDFKLLYRLRDKFKKITILGGEALLNPHVGEIIALTRQYFTWPIKVKLITNGTLKTELQKLKPIIENNHIELVITEYPFISNYREYYDKLKKEFPNATFYTFRHAHGFISEHLAYNTVGTNEKVIWNCEKRYKCCQFVDGKLYICHYAAFLGNLRKITEFDFSNNDGYIDLETCTNSQFDNFFSCYIPEICHHCLFVRKKYEDLDKQDWHRSEKRPEEWIK